MFQYLDALSGGETVRLSSPRLPALPSHPLFLLFRLFRLALELRTQIAQACLDAGELVEVAVAAFLSQLQLLDSRGQAALEHVSLGLRLVLQ